MPPNLVPVMAEKHHVVLTAEERDFLIDLVCAGEASARKITRARILLKADESLFGEAWSDDFIAEALDVGTATVERIRKRFAEEDLLAAINRRKPQRDYQRKVDGEVEAHLSRLVCSTPPAGQAQWGLRLLAEEMVELGYIESISHETVRQTLKKTRSNPG